MGAFLIWGVRGVKSSIEGLKYPADMNHQALLVHCSKMKDVILCYLHGVSLSSAIAWLGAMRNTCGLCHQNNNLGISGVKCTIAENAS